MNLLNKVIKHLTFITVLFFSISTIYGQVNKTVGTRITDVTTEKALKTNAILDLESTSKGFFLPRMTTIQRDLIKKEMGRDNGLAVYNIDNDCVEYWSERANKWMSLCGSLPPAKLDLDQNSCESIKFIGFDTMVGDKPQLKQGTSLIPDKNWMQVRLKVNQVGTYTISANSNNGYFFSGEGQFQAIGSYDIILKGMGTPIRGYDSDSQIKGDKIKFTVNGIDSDVCTDTEVLVIPADLDFVITSTNVNAKGKYNVGVPATLKQGNSIELSIDVIAGGLATVTATNKTLGMKFVGSKKIEVSDKTLMLEPVLGENIPLVNDATSYEFTFEVNTKDPNGTIKGSKAFLTVEKTQIEGMFKNTDFGKEPYYQGDALNENHIIELPIKVINSGKATLYLEGAGLVFKAEDVVLSMPTNEGDTQLVKFTAVKGAVLPKQDTVDLTLRGEASRFEVVNKDKLVLPVEVKPVAYTLNCSSVKTNRTAMPHNKPVGKEYYIIAEVNVTVAGEYEINTSSPVDGISFSTSVNGVKKVFTKTGKQNVELYAIDGTKIPTNKGEYSANLIANDMSAVSCANIKLKVGYGDVNMLIIKYEDDNYNVQEGEALFFSGKNSNGKSRFGEDGVYAETGDVNITTWKMTQGNWSSETLTYATNINKGKYNFIIITNTHTWMSIDTRLGQALIDYVKSGGVLVYTLPIAYGVNPSPSNYLDVLLNLGSNNSVNGRIQSGGTDLLKFLVGSSYLPISNYKGESSFTGNVVDQTNPLSKPKYGVKYAIKSGSIYQDVYWYALDGTYRSAFNISGTNLTSLVADRGNAYKDSRGIILTHKTYSNVVIAPIASNWYRSPMGVGISVANNGQPYANGYDHEGNYNVKTQAGLFIANVYIELMQRVANK